MRAKLNVLIPDGDSTWAMAVIHCLSNIEGYNLHVLSNKKRTPSKYSRFTDYYKYYKRGSNTEWLEVIIHEISANNVDIIIPIAEQELLFFIENRSAIVTHTKLIPIVDFQTFQTASHKDLLSDFCRSHELPHPNSLLSEFNHKSTILNSGLNYPLLIKPLDQKGGDGILKINDEEELVLNLRNHSGSIFIQEYINGYDIDCSVLCLNGKILCHTIQRGNLKGHNDFAPQLGFELFENKELLEVVADTMYKLNWSGIAHIDLRFDEKLNRYCIIEINPRFWGSIGASLKAGVNFPHLCIQLALNDRIEETTFHAEEYMRLKGVIKTLKRRPAFIFNRNYLLKNTEVKDFIKDPLPTMFRFVEWIGRKVGR